MIVPAAHALAGGASAQPDRGRMPAAMHPHLDRHAAGAADEIAAVVIRSRGPNDSLVGSALLEGHALLAAAHRVPSARAEVVLGPVQEPQIMSVRGWHPQHHDRAWPDAADDDNRDIELDGGGRLSGRSTASRGMAAIDQPHRPDLVLRH